MTSAGLWIEGLYGEEAQRGAIIGYILIAHDEDVIGRPGAGRDAAAGAGFAEFGFAEMCVARPFAADPTIEHVG